MDSLILLNGKYVNDFLVKSWKDIYSGHTKKWAKQNRYKSINSSKSSYRY